MPHRQIPARGARRHSRGVRGDVGFDPAGDAIVHAEFKDYVSGLKPSKNGSITLASYSCIGVDFLTVFCCKFKSSLCYLLIFYAKSRKYM